MTSNCDKPEKYVNCTKQKSIIMRTILLLFFAPIMLNSCDNSSKQKETLSILAFSKTEGFRHDVIPTSVNALQKMGERHGWYIQSTEDSLMIARDILDTTDVVVFLHTTGNILGEEQREALKNFVTRGGGLVTLHSGTITENEWPWFVDAVGAIFTGHPPTQEGRLIIENRDHPATAHFEDTSWVTTDEWYSFDRNPRNNADILISIDEKSYEVEDNRWFEGAHQGMGDHPLVWCKTVDRGRVFQTALGHEPALYENPLFLKHIEGAIQWAGKSISEFE